MRGAIVAGLSIIAATSTTAVAEPIAEPGTLPRLDRLAPPGMTPKIELEDDVSEIQQLVGPPTAFFFGFGLGHVVEGRWKERGWIFTFGETAGMVMWTGAFVVDNSSGRHSDLVAPMAITGMLTAFGLHVWECIDSVTGARAKNRRVMMQRVRLAPLLQPPRLGAGGVAGLTLSF